MPVLKTKQTNNIKQTHTHTQRNKILFSNCEPDIY